MKYFVSIKLIMAENWSMDETPVVVGPEVQDIKLFGKWSADEVQVGDISLTVSMHEKIEDARPGLNIMNTERHGL